MTSPFAAELLQGPPREGRAVGHGYVRFGDDVLAVTPPGAPRMPNGIAAELVLTDGQEVTAGGGALRTADRVIEAGPLWDPRPRPRFVLDVRPRPHVDLETLPGRGPGLTPLGDDILIGYLAGMALAGADATVTTAQAEAAGRRTTALSGTLLRVAAEGQLPEVAHALLERGDPRPLLGFGATSGRGVALGLCLSGIAGAGDEIARFVISVPLAHAEARFELVVSAFMGPRYFAAAESSPPPMHLRARRATLTSTEWKESS